MPIVATAFGAMEVEQAGQGPELVLLHSLLTDRSAFDRVRKPLAERHRLTLVHLPGYGQSVPSGSSVEDYADRVAALLDALQLPRSCTVLGNGLGGFVSLALAIRHGARFGRLIIVDALAGFPEAGKTPLRTLAQVVRTQGMAGALDAAVRRMFNPPFIVAHPDVIEERRQVLRQMDAATFATLCEALTRVEFEPQLPTILNPTLVLAGAQDQTTSPELVRKVAAGIPGARFVQIDDAGHCPQIEQPERFVATVEEFLAS